MLSNQIAREIFYYFRGLEEETFSDVRFVLAYQNTIKPTPVTKPIVAVSVKECQVGERLKETLETGEVMWTNNRNVDTTVSMDIFLPYSSNGIEAVKIYDRIASIILFQLLKYDTLGSTCGPAEYDTSCQAIVVRTTFTIRDVTNA